MATIGVNPSSTEFKAQRCEGIQNQREWKKRLRDYFKGKAPAHKWFQPWRIGLELLGMSYEEGTAAHLDVSYRTTTAMLRNEGTDPDEFRCMVERDVQWFFKLLPLCTNLRLLLTFGPIIRRNRSTESLLQFLKVHAPRNGFMVLPDGNGWKLQHQETKRSLFVHDVHTRGEKCVACRVVKNLYTHRQKLRERLGVRCERPFA